MLVCVNCGGRNEAGADFCGSCGEYLDWSAAPAPDSPAPTPTRSVIQGPPMLLEQHEGTLDHEAAAGGAAPVEVKPGEEVRRRPADAASGPDRPVAPDEVPCARCGAGNDRARHFCRRCGAPLAVVVAHRPPWWRRLPRALAGVLRGRRYAAGERRKRRRPLRAVRALLLILALLITVTMVIEPSRRWVNGGIERLRDRVADPAPVTPTTSAASSEARGHGPALVHDGVSNSYWMPARAGTGAGQWLELTLGDPVRLLYVLITPGIAADQKRFLTQARPRVVEVTLVGADGGTSIHPLTVRDQPGAQRFALVRSDVVKVRLTVLSAYGVAPGRRPAIAEVELRAR